MNDAVRLLAGEPVTLTNCEREPIHVPGTLQPGGVLLACDAAGRVTHASANLQDLVPLDARAALGLSLAEVLANPAAAEAVAAAVRTERYALANVLPLSLNGRPCLALAHESEGRTVVEIEPASPVDRPDANLLRVQNLIQGLRRSEGLSDLLDLAAAQVKALTGYDRVMVYRFDPDGHGEVMAEAREDGQEPYVALRYPASDIPPQARRLYLHQRVRVIGDVDDVPVPVLGEEEAGLLDMTYCVRRSVSPMHLQYLRNMGVRASLGVSLIVDGMLWGLLMGHHRSERRPSAEIRALCDLLGQVLSLLIRARQDLERVAGRRSREALVRGLEGRMGAAATVAAGLAEVAGDLLAVVGAEGALLRLGGQVQLIGRTPPPADALRILAALRARDAEGSVSTDCLGDIDPDLADLAPVASGALLMPLQNNPGDGVLWLRPELPRTVAWGGDPDHPAERDPLTGEFSPRRSFAAWTRLQRGRSAPWSPADLEAARELRRAVTTALLRHAEARLAELSHRDPLTGLPNRRAVEARLAEGGREGPTSLLVVDLDRFKSVNDSLGHTQGDWLLEQVARRLQVAVGPGPLVARLGGDEFVILCDAMAAATADALADRVLDALREPFSLGGRPYHLTASLGVASATSEARRDLLNSADMAMYAAKSRGGGLVVRFEGKLHESLRRRIEVEQDLFTALERGELHLDYQPILRIPDRALLGAEALLRWRHPRLGPLSPAEFIPLAEETGLIQPIGAWVLREATRQLALWRRRQPDLYVSVNVSGQQLARAEVLDAVEGALLAADLPPAALILEVTESVLMQETAARQLERLRGLGVGVAVDDFGTGFSSLAYLRRLPVSKLKIDRSFLAQVGEEASATAMFEAIVRLGHTLGLDVVAEGVETAAQWHYLRALDGDAAQGFWLSRPLPLERLQAMLP